MVMNNKKTLVIIFVLLLLMSTLVSAGFLSFVRSVFFGQSVTGYVALNEGCDNDLDCDTGLICDWTAPVNGKKGSCAEFPAADKTGCQGKVDSVAAKLEILRDRLKAVEAKSHV